MISYNYKLKSYIKLSIILMNYCCLKINKSYKLNFHVCNHHKLIASIHWRQRQREILIYPVWSSQQALGLYIAHLSQNFLLLCFSVTLIFCSYLRFFLCFTFGLVSVTFRNDPPHRFTKQPFLFILN